MYQDPASAPTAKSLAIDLLSTMPSRPAVPVAALVRAAALFEIGENSMRVALARLRSRGLVESDQRGLYRLSGAARPVNRQVRSWPSIEASVGDWDGSWIAVETSALPAGDPRDRRASRTRERALRLLGFEALTPALRVRPNNLLGGTERCRQRLAEFGHAPAPVVFRLAEFDAGLEQRARALWDVHQLEARYRATTRRLEESAQRLPQLPRAAAMAESFRLGGAAVRQIVLDPLLPEAIVDTRARRALIDAMRRYDRLGREHWRRWAGASLEPERSPVGFGGFDTTPEAVAIGTENREERRL